MFVGFEWHCYYEAGVAEFRADAALFWPDARVEVGSWIAWYAGPWMKCFTSDVKWGFGMGHT